MKNKVYLDQNIIGYILDNSLILKNENFQFVYSETHFKEFSNDNYKDFCKALDSIHARCLKINLNNELKIQDNGTLLDFTPSEKLYKNFMAKYNPDLESSQDGLLTYLFGSINRDNINSLSNNLKPFIDELSEVNPKLKPNFEILENYVNKVDNAFFNVLPEINEIENNRKVIGTNKGKLNIFKENIIIRINNVIKEQIGINFLDYILPVLNEKSTYEKVVGLHTFLNMVGFNPDRNLKQIDKMPSIRHDGEHIGHSIFCNYLLSEDRRFINKAVAIFEFLNLYTNVFLLQFKKNE